MGEGRLKQKALAGKKCIYCGGGREATTWDHCPPRSLFMNKQWPEGFVFPSCEACNHGTSNDDLMVAFLAQMEPNADAAQIAKGKGLMHMVNKQFPGILEEMFGMSITERRATARRLRMQPEAGQTYKELGLAHIPDYAHVAVGSLARKLSMALFFRETGNAFPEDGGIMFHWFTNATLREYGQIIALEASMDIPGLSPPLQRGGKNLEGQFSCLYSVDGAGELHMLRVVFGKVFGFMSLFSQQAGRIERVHDQAHQNVRSDEYLWRFVAGSRARQGAI
jgi:hypothetical protein